MWLPSQKSVLLALAVIAITGAAASDCYNLDGMTDSLVFEITLLL